jgi:hypothetical protein
MGSEMNRKPFDLERAKAGDPVVTVYGKPFRFAGFNPDADPQERIVGWTDYGHGVWGVSSLREIELFMAPKKRTVWVRLYMNSVMKEVYAHVAKSEASLSGSNLAWLGPAFLVEIED